MRTRVVLFLLVMLLVFTVPVKAKQAALTGQPRTSSDVWNGKLLLAYISIWPEYEYSTEKPGQINVKVINRFVIDSLNVKFPTTVRIQIPASAITPGRVQVGKSPETVSDQGVEFTTSAPDANGWIDVLVTTSEPAIEVDYYDYKIARKDVSREYIYEWPGTYAAGTFHMDVRVPKQATNMRSDPDAFLSGTDPDGFKFGELSVPNMTAGKIFTMKINYDRDTDQPSAILTPQVTAAPTPVDTPVSAPPAPSSSFPLTIVWLTLLLIILVACFYWFSTRGTRKSSRRGGKGKR
jgi:hypothetical protein